MAEFILGPFLAYILEALAKQSISYEYSSCRLRQGLIVAL